MRNLRQRATAVALSVIMCAGMVIFSPTLHAQGPSDRWIAARCANIARGLQRRPRLWRGSALAVYLQGRRTRTASPQPRPQ